jgi:hypothetical protein
MAYSSGGLIQATDYNSRVTNINDIWGTGSGSNGYGQSTTLSTVTGGTTTVSATQWATLIARLDSMRTHQSGSGSGITQPTAGNVVTYLSAVDTQLASIVTNKLAAATRGTATLIGNPQMTSATTWQTTATKEYYTTVGASADTVRYYFNAGGQLYCYLTLTGGGTTKATDWNTFLTTTVGTITLGSNYCSRSGTGGDNLTQNTSVGFHNLTTTYQTLFNIGSTSATADYGLNSCLIEAKLGGAIGAASSNLVYFKFTLTDTAADSFNDTIIGTVNVFSGRTAPEVVNLTDSWGTLTATTVTNTQS